LNGSAVMVSPNSARSNCFMATALYEFGRELEDKEEQYKAYEEAEFYADRSLAIYPEYLSANQIKAGLVALRYQRHKKLPKLLKEFSAILRARPQVQYIQQYMEYLNGREDSEQLTNFYYENGYSYLAKEKGQYPLAITYLKLGEQIAPNDPRILFGLGKSFYNGGDQVQGQQYLNRAYSLNPALRDLN